ncbi:hypothetical protein ACFYO5_34695 [Streptomyces sp. NPDC006259]|uniref:hypothetical protein n=1 Tax=Streptomyces sp. NPDC006259 TaxID=3364740 RepID=UPI0036C57EA0
MNWPLPLLLPRISRAACRESAAVPYGFRGPGDGTRRQHRGAAGPGARDEAHLRAAFEVAGRMLAGDVRPDGQVVSVGNAADDPMMLLASDIIQLCMRGEPDLAWAQVEPLHPAKRAAVLFILAALLNYRFAVLDPLVLAAGE